MGSKPEHGKGNEAHIAMKASFVSQLVSRIYFCVALTALSLTAVAEAAQVDVHKQYTFNLPRQTVADSLNDIAKHTGAQFLFPYELAKSVTAKPVSGYFTLLEATSQLLQNTGLKSDLVDGVLTISSQDDASTAFNQSKGKSMNIKHRKSLLATLVGLFAAGGAATATAQDEMQESARAQNVLDEIIVTAQKREQNLQDVGLAISAITGEGLAKRGIDSPMDLQYSIPSLSLGSTVVGNAQVTIRGVGVENIVVGGDPGVPLHMDGHYLQSSAFMLHDLLDIERVEILRGPQGTLYGRNAIGGSINIISNRPTDELTGKASLAIGNYGRHLFQGVISGSVHDNVRARLAVADEKRDGYIENVSDLGGEDLGSSNYTNIRSSFEFDVSDNVEVFLSGYYYKNTGNGVSERWLGDYPSDTFLDGQINYYELNNAGSNITLSDPRKVRVNDVDGEIVDKAEGVSVDIDWDMGGFTFRSLTAYNKNRHADAIDSDASDVVNLNQIDFNQHETYTQEFQLVSADREDFNWILGAFYYDETGAYEEFFDWDNLFEVGGDKFVAEFGRNVESKSIGLFGQFEYALTDRSELIFGLRYDHDEKDYSGFILIPLFGLETPEGSPIVVPFKDDWENVSGKIGINFHLNEDVLLYGSFATGYKAGGYNDTSPAYDPETVEAFELGLKGGWFDNKVQGNVSLFHYDYKDKQEFKRDDTIGLSAIVNAAEATING